MVVGVVGAVLEVAVEAAVRVGVEIGVEIVAAVLVAAAAAIEPQRRATHQYLLHLQDWIPWKPNCWDEILKQRLLKDLHGQSRLCQGSSQNGDKRSSIQRTGM